MLSRLVVAALLLASLPGLTRNKTAAITQTAGSTAATPPIKMGLWEATVTNSLSPNPIKSRSCIDVESYQKSMASVPPGCTITNKKQTATSISGDLSCNLQHGGTATGHVDVEMPDASTMQSTVNLTVTAQGQTVPMKLTTDSHFISADCGDIAPGQGKVVQ